MITTSKNDQSTKQRDEKTIDILNDHELIDSTAEHQLSLENSEGEFFIYPAQAGYDLRRELQFLSNRTIEPNVFFTGQFLAPAMPRLDERNIRLAIIRDISDTRSRMRFLMPFSIEKPGFSIGPSMIRSWSNPFGPIGTPLLDAENAQKTIDQFLNAITNPSLKLPSVMVFPDLQLDGIFLKLLHNSILSRGLPLSIVDEYERPALQSSAYGEDYLAEALPAKTRREMRRQLRKLNELGEVVYEVIRAPEEIRVKLEEFLHLEASGWKGKKGTAMIIDRYHAAFVREAINNLAENDSVRIHTLNFNGQAIASMIVFIFNGEAFTWKTAYNEAFSHFSPGKLLMEQLTIQHLDDPNITRTDSCGIPDHPIMSRFWKERIKMGTVIIGLTPNSDKDVRQTASQMHLYKSAKKFVRDARDRYKSFVKF